LTTVRLPRGDGTLETYSLAQPRAWSRPSGAIHSRIAYAAAHVVADPCADNVPGAPAILDWDATLAFRRHLWSYGLGVADAMDTAQRGMGMDWPATEELIGRSAAEARSCGGLLACGAGTDHAPAELSSLDEITAAYEQQIEVVEAAGAKVVLMASRQLAQTARGPEEYAKVYDRLLEQTKEPVILHWLGPMFDPGLAGYWGYRDLTGATESFLTVIRNNANKVDGVKVSLLDADHELYIRASLPDGVHLYTGDDFNFPDLIKGDQSGYSDALLGIFDAIAPAASAALQALDSGDIDGYDTILAPTIPLSRHLFAEPTYFYKTGVVFCSWLAGYQPAFTMVSGLQSARSVPHLVKAFRLADQAGLFPDPEQAASRMRHVLALVGVQQ
jgi:hypothetical protein